MTLSDKIDSLMMKVEKPVRYTGGEFNEVIKEPASVKVRYAFLFPDVYEVGMSHLGMKILYHTINKRDDCYCERVFSPWVDMEKLMAENDIPLFSMETRTPVGEFDILGITLQYEMSYTNVVAALRMAGIPIYQKDRKNGNYPFVVCGGPCAFNPEPLADFVDFFAIGDGEIETHEYIDKYIEWKNSGKSREEFLKSICNIQGIYVPSLYECKYDETTGILLSTKPVEGSGAPEKVYKGFVKDLTAADYPEKLIVPYGEIVHDRIMLEIFRGCTRGCRFCQAGMIYRPVRERSMERLLELAEKLVDATGYDEISLMSLSSGDYSCLPELAREMVKRFYEKRVSISLPSQRIDNLLTDTLNEVQKVRKTGLTLAVEAGSQRLRNVINKGVTEEDLMRSVRDAFESGWSSVKVYLMLGLPTETDEDALEIVELAKKLRGIYFSLPKEKRTPGFRITLSASVFVPKPFTPFQWQPQVKAEDVERRQKLIRTELAKLKGVDFKYHEMSLSFLEAVFALGDRRLSKVLAGAVEKGCRFDGWNDQFDYDRWMQVFEETGIDPVFYANREKALDECLPWDHIDAGITKEFLLREWDKAQRGELTHDCRKGCVGCGVKRYKGACE